MSIKKGDFIEINYTGKLKEDGTIFDTNVLKVAEDAGLIHKHESGHDHNHLDQFSSLIICVGEKHVLPGLDEAIVGSNVGHHTIYLTQEHAFGKKDARLITTFPISFFKKQKISPYSGLQLNFDGKIGVVRSVGGGRVMVDFNHPLAGKDVVYDVEIKRIVTDEKEKVEGLLRTLKFSYDKVILDGKKITITYMQEVSQKYLDVLRKDLIRLIGLDVELKRKAGNDLKDQKQNEKGIKKNVENEKSEVKSESN